MQNNFLGGFVYEGRKCGYKEACHALGRKAAGVYGAVCGAVLRVNDVHRHPAAARVLQCGRCVRSACGLVHGPVFGGVAAGLGSCLADILSGYILYAPVTFFVKGIDAVASYFVWRALRLLVTKDNLDFLARIGAAVVGETLMVLGYFLFETALYGVAGGAASLIGNALQGTFGVVCSVLLVSILYRLKAVRGFFSPLMCPPHLKKEA